MGRNLLIALCLWSCILIVNCTFSDKAVQDVTDHIMNTIINNIWKTAPQVAFIVKLTEKECSIRTNKTNPDLITDIPDDFFNAINLERREDFSKMKDAMNENVIYSGNRILMATSKNVTKRKKTGEVITYTEHAEYRLLTPEGNQAHFPFKDFMKKKPKAHGVIFYSLISPCVDKCINKNNDRNILNSLRNNFQQLRDRAFVYRFVFTPDMVKLNDKNKRQEIINAWRGLDQIMPLFRCIGGTCKQCFQNGTINEFCTQFLLLN